MSRGDILELGLVGGLRWCLGRRGVRVVLVLAAGPGSDQLHLSPLESVDDATLAGQQVAEPLLLFVDLEEVGLDFVELGQQPVDLLTTCFVLSQGSLGLFDLGNVLF